MSGLNPQQLRMALKKPDHEGAHTDVPKSQICTPRHREQ
jgi:hypothetical protein